MNKNMDEHKHKNIRDSAVPAGFTLIEVVVYLAIFSMIAVTLVSLSYASAMQDQQTTASVINAYEND